MSPEPIAIVGMACRLPGDVSNPEEFWEFLVNGRTGYSEFPSTRLNIDAWHGPDVARPGSFVSRGGYFLQHDLNKFDNDFFGISAVEASSMDAAQKQLLEVAYEACDAAGVTLEQLSGSLTGVYVGNFCPEQSLAGLKDSEFMTPYTATGASTTMLSNRINYALNLKGPSLTIDTACASSAYALHLACAGLRNHDCDAALVCAANTIRSVEAQLFMSRLGALSPTSQCHTFDASADGYARADGVVAFYVMRLSDALCSGLPIRAVVRGTAVGANGSGESVTKPSGMAQSTVIRKAYENAGISDLGSTGYFECHGTGTPIGDVIETRAVGDVFSAYRDVNDPLLIGSVKPNLGHSEGAAALTALMKAVLAIEAKLVPPTVGIQELNPSIEFNALRLKVVQKPTHWPETAPIRRASINSFGFGGANAHIIVEGVDSALHQPTAISQLPSDDAWMSLNHQTYSRSETCESSGSSSTTNESSTLSTPDSVGKNPALSHGRTLLVCSAKSHESLNQTIEVVGARLRTQGPVDIAKTLAHRSQLEHRAYAVCDSSSEPTFKRAVKCRDLQLGFIFTGGGAQWPKMGEQLLQFPAFLNSIRRIDEDVAALPDPPNWTVEETMRNELPADKMNEPRIAQYMTAALEIALVDLLADWGIRPSMVAGHSAGEIAAAYASGHLTHTEASAVAYYRGKATSEAIMAPGAMLAVGLAPTRAEQLIPEDAKVIVGAVNSPGSVTLSGDRDAVMNIKAKCDKDGIFNRLIATNSVAYHSSFMEPAAKAYITPLEALRRPSTRPSTEETKLYSTVTGSLYQSETIPMNYWRENMESPVLFASAVTAMRMAGLTHLVEIGPHSTLRLPVMDTIKSVASDLPFTYAAAVKRNEDAVLNILSMCGELALAGVEVDVPRVNGNGGVYLSNFPTYRWTHQIITQESRVDREWRLRRFPRHDLLGSLVPGLALEVYMWRNILSASRIPWLNEYQFGRDCIFPTSGFIFMVVEAMRQISETIENDSYVIEDLHICAVLLVNDDMETFVTMRRLSLGPNATFKPAWEFNISTVSAGVSTLHVTGRIHCLSEPFQPNDEKHRNQHALDSQSVEATHWYDELAVERGISLGGRFRRMNDLTFETRKNQASASIDLDSPLLHPTDLESCFTLPLLAVGTSRRNQAFLPVSVDRLFLSNRRLEESSVRICSKAEHSGLKNIQGSSFMVAADKTIVRVDGLRFSRLSKPDNIKRQAYQLKHRTFWRLSWVDDYEGITKDNEDRYLPPENYRPKLYEYSRYRRTKLAQMWVIQFAQERPDLLARSPISTQHARFIEWINWLLEVIMKESPEIYTMSLAERAAAIEAERVLSDPGIKLSWEIYDHLYELMDGTRSVMDIITKGGLLSHFYETQLVYDKFERVVELMGLRNPTMRILEIGAGTGSATKYVLRSLVKGGTQKYSSYTFTDISPSFFETAAARFAQYSDMEYKVYNMENSPEEQDIVPGSFDLVVASCTVHITPNIVNALKSIRKLLKPGGHLLLSEITAEHHDINFTLALFPGFYDGYEEGRKRHPFLTTEQWTEALPKAGFTVPEVSVNDVPEDWHTFTVLTARAVETTEQVSSAETRHVTVLGLGDSAGPLVQCIQEQARKQGIPVTHKSLTASNDDELTTWSGSSRLIVVGELDQAMATSSEKPVLERAAKILAEAKTVLQVTQTGLVKSADSGRRIFKDLLARQSVRHGFKMVSIDFDDACQQDDIMAQEILRREANLTQLRDIQHHQHDGRWLIPRLLPDQRLIDNWKLIQGTENTISSIKLGDAGPLRLSTKGDGTLSTLGFEKSTAVAGAMSLGQLEINVKAVGMSMVDFLGLTGSYATNSPSSEFAGIVTATSHDVTDFSVGDRVFSLWPGRFENKVRVPASMCQMVRPGDSFEMAATLPLAYCTAWYAIVEVAHTHPGDRILIQSATGGLGMAAIAVAQSVGAEVYATAGSASKRATLCDLGIPENRIFPSRDASVEASMKKSTNGHGFDVVLNISSGDYLQAGSWPLVALFGRFVELRRSTDLSTEGGIWNLKKLSQGVSILPVDILGLCRQRPEIIARAMSAIGTRYRTGIFPALPLKVFPISQLGQAYVEFSRFEHTGKLVLSYSDDEDMPYFPILEVISFRDDGAYLIVGPLNDLTVQLTKWMTRNGARHLVFLIPLSPQGHDSLFLDELSAAGISATCLTGAASNIDDVRRAISTSAKPAICGIFYTTGLRGSLETGCGFDIDTQNGKAADEQAAGLGNLHSAFLDAGWDLDVFAVLTSMALPNGGLETENEVATNAFYWSRRKQGLPCTCIHLGVSTPTHHALELLGTALSTLLTPAASQAEGPIYILADVAASQQGEDWLGGTLPRSFGQMDGRWAIYAGHHEMLARKAATATAQAPALSVGDNGGNVKELVTDRLSKLLWIPREKLRLDGSLNSMGIDSMIASEFQSWIQQTFHTSVGMWELLAQQTTIEKLAGVLSGSNGM